MTVLVNELMLKFDGTFDSRFDSCLITSVITSLATFIFHSFLKSLVVCKVNSKRVFFLAFAILIIIIELAVCEIITTPDGRIEGTMMQSRHGINFHAFLKIPFAQPPIGELRFREPLPNEPWLDILPGTEYGSACSQPAGLVPAANISEDCLHLNVFSRCLPGSGSGSLPKAVIVYIHGGGFEMGSAIISSPSVFMDRDIVLVTINYRQGAFGFLATGTAEAPGNAGMKDQVMALRWIKRNIAAFGGDDENITIFGMSGGAFSTTAHMTSTLSRGLFHRVIGMSGAITSHKLLTNHLLDNAKVLGTALNCDNDDPDKIVRCLRTKSEAEILSIHFNGIPEEQTCQKLAWWPVVEPDFGQDRFLEHEPTHLFEIGNFTQVPTMIGIAADEFAQSAPGVLRNSSFLMELNERFEEVAPTCFLYEEGTERSRAMSKHFRETYFPYEVIDVQSFEDIGHIASDSVIGYPTHLFVNLASKFVDVYYYRFSHIGSFSLFLHPRNDPYAVAHGDDIHYLIPWPMFPIIGVDNPDNFIVERLLSIYENFARNGNPNNSTDAHLSTMNWPAYDAVDAFYLDIGRHLVEKHGLYLNRYVRWENVYYNSACELQLSIIALATVIFATMMNN